MGYSEHPPEGTPIALIGEGDDEIMIWEEGDVIVSAFKDGTVTRQKFDDLIKEASNKIKS